MAISALVAVDPIGDELVAKIKDRVSKLTVGPGDDERSEMGPLVTEVHRDKVASYLDQRRRAGRDPGDRRPRPPGHRRRGRREQRRLLARPVPARPRHPGHAPPTSDEIFGPVLSVVRADSYASAVELVNNSPYGNGVAIFTNDGGAARRFVSEAEIGMVGVNVPIPVPMAYYSFGGWKASLFGDTHVHGTEGVHFYTRGKVVTSRWLDPSHGGVNLGFPVNS